MVDVQKALIFCPMLHGFFPQSPNGTNMWLLFGANVAILAHLITYMMSDGVTKIHGSHTKIIYARKCTPFLQI
jgi:hypothetical protein